MDGGSGTGLAVRQLSGGGREIGGFTGPAGSKIFSVAHLPAGPPTGAVLLCPALYSEQLTNYRTEVLLTRALASSGVASVRFQYRGTGNSDDLPDRHPTFATMAEDASVAEEWLADLAGLPATAFIGVRLGSLVAAHAVAARPGLGLCCIEPALEGSRWFRELTRARRTAALRRARDAAADDVRSLEELGEFDAFGFRVGWPTASSIRERTLEGELGASPRPVLLVQIAVAAELRRDLAEWADRWREGGAPVHTVNVRQSRSWWFVPDAWEIEEQRPETVELIDAVVSWLAIERVAS